MGTQYTQLVVVVDIIRRMEADGLSATSAAEVLTSTGAAEAFRQMFVQRKDELPAESWKVFQLLK